MTEKALEFAAQQIKNIFKEKDSNLSAEQAERMARRAVKSIDWDNSALMHKGLNWIANYIYSHRDVFFGTQD